MADDTATDLSIKDVQLKKLYAYWLEMPGSGTMPSRAAFDPSAVKRLLPNLILLDIDPETRRLRVRVLGTHVATVYGEDYTGRYLDEIYFGANTSKVMDDYGTCAREGRPVLAERDFRSVRNVAYRMERLILPFSDDGKVANKLIAGLHFVELR